MYFHCTNKLKVVSFLTSILNAVVSGYCAKTIDKRIGKQHTVEINYLSNITSHISIKNQTNFTTIKNTKEETDGMMLKKNLIVY